jgi:glutathione synthase/RimK-type ligase-like ATP-grasp enzyme
MPSTVLFDGSELRGRVIKKRISARAKHVYFQRSDLPSNYKPNDYISQTRLDIVRELRIYMIGGDVVKPAVSKTSKTINQKVRLSDVEDNIPEQALDICETVYQATNLDFVGLDIAETSNGCYLLEVNRSCQFKGYKRLTGVNLAVGLDKYLLTKLVKNT